MHKFTKKNKLKRIKFALFLEKLCLKDGVDWLCFDEKPWKSEKMNKFGYELKGKRLKSMKESNCMFTMLH